MKVKLYFLILFGFVNSMYVIAQDFRFGKVSKEELEEKIHPQDPAANAAILYREVKTAFEYNTAQGFYMTTDVFERVKFYTKEGFDWATKNVDLYQSSGGNDDEINGLKAYTYFLGADGKIEETKLKDDGIFETETNKYVHNTKFTMPNLREGCIIEYKYSVKSSFISSIEEFRFQETIPVNSVSVKFSSPEYFSFQTHQRGWIPYKIDKDAKERSLNLGSAPDRTTYEGGKRAVNRSTQTRDITFVENIYNIELKNVPALKAEAYAGNINNYATALEFELAYIDFPGSTIKTYSTTWDAVSKTVYDSDSFGNEIERTGYFEDDLAEATKAAVSKDDKILAVFDFVKNKMNWNNTIGYYSGDGVKNAYKKGVGSSADINLMLIGMLRQAGLNANPVLVSTKANGIPLFPTRNGFNYVIAAVERDNDVLLLDASSKNAEPGILSPKIINWQGRLIREDGSSTWVPLTPSAPATQSALVNIAVNEDLSISGKTQCRYTGHYALNMRENFKNTNKDATRKALEESMAQTELSEVSFENLENVAQPVSLSYNFEAFDMAEDVSGKLYFAPMAFLAEKESPFKLNERLYPVDFSYAKKDRYIINIDLPEGYKIESMPQDAALSLGERSANFKYAIKQVGNKLQLSVELAFNDAFIAAEDYNNLKQFYQMVVEKENEKVVLMKI